MNAGKRPSRKSGGTSGDPATAAQYRKDFSAEKLLSYQDLPELTSMFTHYRDVWNEFGDPFFSAMYASTGIDRLNTELIVISTLALRGYRTGLIHHTLLALREGATPQQIRGAIFITLATGGFASASPGLAWADEVLLPYERGELDLTELYPDD
jgi:alkylhydroperoxidase/carboxymuconolactone decarboxylase family protein YurZ